jgi:hypothetical protein
MTAAEQVIEQGEDVALKHECCWHLKEVLGDRRTVERCCWCDHRRTVVPAPYAAPEHGRYIYR